MFEKPSVPPEVKLASILSRVSHPGRYLGNEVNTIHKNFDEMEVRVCLVFPDKYEIGMSHVGLKILYEILNRLPHVVAERCYAPDLDLEEALRRENLPLFSLESKRPLADFDIIGVSLTYELTYVNMINILDLGGIPVWQKDRTDKHPIVLGGGGCMMNAEPVAEFLDAGGIGDGEELILDVVEAVRQHRRGVIHQAPTRKDLLHSLSEIEGVYVPSLFEAIYNEDHTLKEMRPLKEGYTHVKKRIVANIDTATYPTKIVVPNVKPIHDRIGIEIQRGCNRFCRFCQAGYIDRPVRQRSPDTILKIAEDSYRETGIDEISLLSLSAADYACLVPLLSELNARYADKKVSLSVPATRTEKMTPELITQIKKVRRTGFTIAPEAGSERMRRVINKGNKVEDMVQAVRNAFSQGWQLMKLYYMVGLPFEEDDDAIGIARESQIALDTAKEYNRNVELNTSVSSFVPKPHTPFQWEPQLTIEETRRRHGLVKHNLRDKRIRFKNHKPEMSYLEGLFSRGDRRLAQLIYLAFKEGCRFDEWEEHFSFPRWQEAIKKWEIDPAFYLHRMRGRYEVLPWDHLFAQMDKKFLWNEYEKAREAAEGIGEKAPRPSEEKVVSENEWRKPMGLRHFKKTLPSLPHHHTGFSEDCSVERCTNCGVCDFTETKNRIFVIGNEGLLEKKAHREWTGWKPLEAHSPSCDAAKTLDGRFRLRVGFAKKGDSRYFSHLELMSVIKRAVIRAGFKALYSQGFHPQMKLAMGFPLPLGVESDMEYFDLDLAEMPVMEEFIAKMNEGLPLGIRIHSAVWVDLQRPSIYSALGLATYDVRRLDDATFSQDVLDHAKNLTAGVIKEWRRVKEGKTKIFDLSQDLSILEARQDLLTFSIRYGNEGSLKVSEALFALGVKAEELDYLSINKSKVTWKRAEEAFT